MISIGPKLGELLILPMTSIVTPPDFSVDDPARDRSTREDDSPQVPCLSPSRLRAQVHYGVTVVVGNHGAALKKNKARRAQYSRPTASPCWVRMGQYPVQLRYRFRRTLQRNSLVKLDASDPG